MTLAAGLATLRALTPEVYAHLDSLGARLATGLAKAFDDAGRDARVVRCASMVNVWPSAEPVSDMRMAGQLDGDWWEEASFALTCKGYRMSSGWMQMVRQPPTAHLLSDLQSRNLPELSCLVCQTISEPMTEAIIDDFVEAVREVLEEEGVEVAEEALAEERARL